MLSFLRLPVQVSALNISYSDSGLFGIMLACESSDSGKVREGGEGRGKAV